MDNFQLYRTTPKLSGNMMLDLIVDESQITDFHIRPISDLIPYVLIKDENLLVRPHQMNIKNFWEKTQGYFFNPVISEELDSDWPIIIPKSTSDEEMERKKQWDDTYWCGTKRSKYQLYNKTHETLFILWIEKISKDDTIGLVMEHSAGINTIRLKYPKDPYHITSFHDRFCKYLFDYLEYIGLYEGNDRCISIDFDNNTCYLSGLDVQSGNLITRKDRNVTKNLISRERPLLEQNSIITNAFSDVLMILPQFLILNVIWTPGVSSEISTSVFINNDDDYVESDDREMLEKRDIYTNHHFIPRFDTKYSNYIKYYYEGGEKIKESDGSEESHPNVYIPNGYVLYDEISQINSLDYLKDWNNLDLMHKNKMVQPICHWQPINSTQNQLFNVYDGFGCYTTNEGYKYSQHGFINITDPVSISYDGNFQNQRWLKFIYDSENVFKTCMDNINTLIDCDGFYTKLDSNKYTAPNVKFGDMDVNMYVSIVIPNSTDDNNVDYTESLSSDVSSTLTTSTIEIITGRTIDYTYTALSGETKTKTIETLPEFGTLLDKLGFVNGTTNEYTREVYKNLLGTELDFGGLVGEDKEYNYTMSHDYINRFYGYNGGSLFGADGSSSHVAEEVDYKKLIVNLYQKDSENIYVIFGTTKDNEEVLMLGNIIKHLTNYYNYNKNLMFVADDIDDDLNIINPDVTGYLFECVNILKMLRIVIENLNKYVRPSVIYFNDSIIPAKDSSLDVRTKEENYYKTTNTNNYVVRISDNLRPAMFPARTFVYEVPEGTSINETLYCNEVDIYGRNFLWLKDKFKIDSDDSYVIPYKQYADTNVPPLYTSVEYDPVKTFSDNYIYKDKNDEDFTVTTPKNILIYNCIPSILKTETKDEWDNTEYIDKIEEYKWFDRSQIKNYENYEIDPEPWNIAVAINDKDTIENSVLDYFVEQFGNITKTYLKDIYNIEYDFQGISLIGYIPTNNTSVDGYTYVEVGSNVPDITKNNQYVIYKYIVNLVLK